MLFLNVILFEIVLVLRVINIVIVVSIFVKLLIWKFNCVNVKVLSFFLLCFLLFFNFLIIIGRSDLNNM